MIALQMLPVTIFQVIQAAHLIFPGYPDIPDLLNKCDARFGNFLLPAPAFKYFSGTVNGAW